MTIDGIQTFAESIAAVIAAIAAAGGALVWLHRRMLRPVVQRWDAAIDLINSQLMPNGGGSLIDKVNSIDGIHRDVKEIREHLESTSHRMDKIEWALSAAGVPTPQETERAHGPHP